MIGTICSNSSLIAATTSSAGVRSAKPVKSADVDEHDRHLDLLAGEVGALLEDVLGDVGIDVGAERLADPLALGEAGDHLR